MLANRTRRQATRIVAFAPGFSTTPRPARLQWRRHYSSDNQRAPNNSPFSSPWFRITLGVLGVTSAASVAYLIGRNKQEDVAPKTAPVDITFETPRADGALSTEEVRERLSSQHVQVKKSLENPGVYAWGSNSGRVVDPDSDEAIIKAPRRISYFNGQLLRDLKLDERSGAAITENGDLVQWGKGFSETEFKPTKTLTGKDLVSLCMSRDRIIALSSNGSVYSLPISKDDQRTGRKLQESSWLPFWAGRARLSYRLLQPRLGLGEKVVAISGGLEHVLLLTSSGRVFSAASATEHYPSKGQLGIPGLTWATRPAGPVDSCHEITELRGTKIVQIASGDYHSLALSKDGRVFVFGDNGFGQLGVEFDPAAPFIDKPTALPLQSLYPGKKWVPKATSIAAGGATSFFTVDAKRILGPEEDPSEVRDLGRISADTWAFGKGIYGTLGNGRWTHLQDEPTKVKALSGLYEYDDKTKKLLPIRLHRISVGSTHASAVLANNTHLTVSNNASQNETYFGSDALFWGGNEFWQLGTGKRNNVPAPTHIRPPADIENPDSDKEQRFQVVPHYKGKVGNRTVTMEQRIECGKHVSAVYSGV